MPYDILNTALPQLGVFTFIFIIWGLAWKGWALWIAARNVHKRWFIALLIINTLGILEIIYIFAVGKKELDGKGNAESIDVIEKEVSE